MLFKALHCICYCESNSLALALIFRKAKGQVLFTLSVTISSTTPFQNIMTETYHNEAACAETKNCRQKAQKELPETITARREQIHSVCMTLEKYFKNYRYIHCINFSHLKVKWGFQIHFKLLQHGLKSLHFEYY